MKARILALPPQLEPITAPQRAAFINKNTAAKNIMVLIPLPELIVNSVYYKIHCY